MKVKLLSLLFCANIYHSYAMPTRPLHLTRDETVIHANQPSCEPTIETSSKADNMYTYQSISTATAAAVEAVPETRNRSLNILDLPDELVCNVFSYLVHKNFLNFSEANRFNIALRSLWNYLLNSEKLQLHSSLNGYQDLDSLMQSFGKDQYSLQMFEYFINHSHSFFSSLKIDKGILEPRLFETKSKISTIIKNKNTNITSSIFHTIQEERSESDNELLELFCDAIMESPKIKEIFLDMNHTGSSNDIILNNEKFFDILRSKDLERLSIRNHFQHQFNFFSELSKQKKMHLLSKLKKLDIYQANTTQDDLTAIFQLSELEELDISYCENRDTDESLSLVGIENLTKLKILRIAELETDLTVLSKLSELEELDISHCININTGESLSLEGIENFRKLKILRIDGLKADLEVISQLSELEELDMNHCANLQDTEETYINFLKNLTKLKILRIDGLAELYEELEKLLPEVTLECRDIWASYEGE
ncbi:MAG: hypothetical protein C0440_05865 [Candidatus Pelagibacter sp.]|nr:hypothetical protein [Candidatus Pelagibacter sp.]